MNHTEKQFYSLVAKYSSIDLDVHLCKMMSSPGLKFKDKVFAFYHKETMGFRLGPNFNTDKMGIKMPNHLALLKRNHH